MCLKYILNVTISFRTLSSIDTSSQINVYVRSELTESRLATLSSESLGIWKYTSLNLPTCLSQFQLVVEGVIGNRRNNTPSLLKSIFSLLCKIDIDYETIN